MEGVHLKRGISCFLQDHNVVLSSQRDFIRIVSIYKAFSQFCPVASPHFLLCSSLGSNRALNKLTEFLIYFFIDSFGE